jgi:hypothetical protein
MTDTAVPLSIHINVADVTKEFEAILQWDPVEASLHAPIRGVRIQVLDDAWRAEVPEGWRKAGR